MTPLAAAFCTEHSAAWACFAINPADAINGLFEALGGMLILNHCRAVLRDKKNRRR